MDRDFMKDIKVVLWDTTIESESIINQLKKEIEVEAKDDPQRIEEINKEIQNLESGIEDLKKISLELENTLNSQVLKIADYKKNSIAGMTNSTDLVQDEMINENEVENTESIEDETEVAIEEPQIEAEDNQEEVEETDENEIAEDGVAEVTAELPSAEEVEEDATEEETQEEAIAEVEQPAAEATVELPTAEEVQEEATVEEEQPAAETTVELPAAEEVQEEVAVEEEQPATEATVELPTAEEVQEEATVEAEQPAVETPAVPATPEASTDENQVIYQKTSVTEDRGILLNTSQAEKTRASFDNQSVLQAEIARKENEISPEITLPVEEQAAVAQPAVEALSTEPQVTEAPVSAEQELEKMTQEYTEALTNGDEQRANELSNAISEKSKTLQKTA